MYLLTMLIALAAEPAIHLHHEGDWIVGEMDLSAAPSDVLDTLSDVRAMSANAKNLRELTVEPAGRCERLGFTFHHGVPVRVEFERCPTHNGFKQTLLASKLFKTWDAVWEVMPGEHGTKVVYRVQVDVRLPVSRRSLNKQMRTSVENQMRELAHQL